MQHSILPYIYSDMRYRFARIVRSLKKHQISRLGLVPRDVGTVGVLGMGAPAVTNYILAAGGVVKGPIHE